MAVDNQAIWKDYNLTLDANPRSYNVKLSGNTIYAGLAYARPGETYPKIRLNDIAAPYLKQNFPLEAYNDGQADEYQAADIYRTFKVYNATTNVQIGNDVAFYMDWGGEPNRYSLATNTGCHANITDKCAKYAPLIYTLYNTAPISADSNKVKIRTTSNTVGTQILSWSAAGNYVCGDPSNYLVDADTWIQIGRLRLQVVDCIRYVLYYVNAYGGWDELPIEGAVKEWREYNRHSLKRVYNNTNYLARGEVNYANEETRYWEMTTGWLTDEQAGRMHHLIGTTLAFLYDIANDTYTPVVVTDTTCESRAYSREGKPIFYTFTLREAREGMRR